MSFDPGAIFGNYQVIEMLGVGGMGRVYKVRNLLLDRIEAAKILLPDLSGAPELADRFMREIQVQASLNHPHIGSVHTALRFQNQLVMVMEFVEGVTLDARMKQQSAVLEDGLRYIGELLDALSFAHARGVVHRDIKPSNVMITTEDAVKLMDFGIARAVSGKPLTSPGLAIGSAAYMAPEQIQGAAPDPRSDLYSVGVTLYELASGERPFSGDSDYAIMTAHVRQAPRSPRELNPNLSPALEAVILKSLAKNPAERFQSAAEFRDALAALRRPGPMLATVAAARAHGFVGRRSELAELKAAFQSAAAGKGRIVCVRGEPGSGKTALIEAFISSLISSQVSFALAQGRCSARLSEAEPYRSVLEALESLLAGPDGAAFRTLLAQTAPSWSAQLQAPAADGAAVSQERMIREATSFLIQASRTTPLLLFLDDMQWADISTLDLLLDLASRLEGARVLIAVTYRLHEGRGTKNPFREIRTQLRRRGSYREIDLDFLSEADCRNYLALEFPGCQFPAGFDALVRTKTAGNPLFLVELARFLKDRGFLTEDEKGAWRLERPVAELANEAPESVRAMIQAKLDQLSDDERRLLLAASVQGMDFDSAVIARALGEDAANIEEGLDAAQNLRGIVRSAGETELPDGTLTVRYRFAQDPDHEALYASLKPARRASLSAAVADAMIAFHSKQIRPAAAQIALLFEAARKFGQAAEYFRLASQNAAHLGASHEAVALASRGLGLLEKEPEGVERQKKELALRMAFGGPLTLERFGSPDVRQNYLRARELCQILSDEAQLPSATWGLWLSHLAEAALPDARRLAGEMLTIAQQDGRQAWVVEANWAVGTTLGNMGQIAEARKHFEAGIANYDPKYHDAYTSVHGFDPGVACRVELGGRFLWLLGFPDQALRTIQEAQALALSLGHPPSVTFALTFEAVLRQLRGEPAACLERTAEVLGNERAPSNMRAWATLCRGWALSATGNNQGGIEEIESSLTLHRSIGSPMGRPHFLGVLAEALGRSGNVAGALAALGDAFDIMKKTGQRYYEAELMRISGELFLKSNELTTAERYFQDALNVARAQGAKSLELRVSMSLARHWRTRGKQAEAAQLLAATFAGFQEGFETADLAQAGKLTREIGA